jgi:high-affinity Fe2+/Pb2+ permease
MIRTKYQIDDVFLYYDVLCRIRYSFSVGCFDFQKTAEIKVENQR